MKLHRGNPCWLWTIQPGAPMKPSLDTGKVKSASPLGIQNIPSIPSRRDQSHRHSNRRAGRDDERKNEVGLRNAAHTNRIFFVEFA